MDIEFENDIVKTNTEDGDTMDIINFINPEHTSENKAAYDILVHCCFAGFQYSQVEQWLLAKGYYVPKDQWEVFSAVLSIQIDLDIGVRQNEY